MPRKTRKRDTKLLIGKGKNGSCSLRQPTQPCHAAFKSLTARVYKKTKELFNTKNEDQDLRDAAGQTADRIFDEAVSEAEEEFDKFCTGMAFDKFKTGNGKSC